MTQLLVTAVHTDLQIFSYITYVSFSTVLQLIFLALRLNKLRLLENRSTKINCFKNKCYTSYLFTGECLSPSGAQWQETTSNHDSAKVIKCTKNK